MRTRILLGGTAMALAAFGVTATPAMSASAATKAASAAAVANDTDPNVSAVVAPYSYQTNSTVWALASVGGNVFVGGDFTSVRPHGDAAGTGEVARTYIAEFNASTGALQSFDPTLDGDVAAAAISPDGNTLYLGGGFTHVNGSFRDHLAAFSVATGALSTTWKPAAGSKVLSISPSPDGSAVYVGGNFSKLDSVARTYAGEVQSVSGASPGALMAFNPTMDGTVTSVAVAPDGSRVLIGGYFNTFDGVTQHAIGSANPTTGSNEPWAATILPHNSSCTSNVKDIVVKGSVAYIAGEGTGGGCFDGDFAATISTGALVWQNDCLGATQSLAIVGDWLYKGSHAHDCAYVAGGFPQTNPELLHRLLNQSLTDGTLGHWYLTTNGNNLGPRVMATDGSSLFVGGDFTTVNSAPQQGFAIFPPTPGNVSPTKPGTPAVTSTEAGVDSVHFTGSSAADTGTLTYRIFRDGGTTPIAMFSATSYPWALPYLDYRDTGLTPGSTHTYQVTASTGPRTSAKSTASAPVTVSATSPSQSYAQTVLAAHPSFFWRLGDTSGSTATDSSPNNFTGIYESGTTQGAAGPINGDSTTATSFNGSSSGLVTAAHSVSNPQVFSIELWFKTTTNQGGKLVGFGNSQAGTSSNYDRHVYMMNDGQLTFGVYNSGIKTIETPDAYNDGRWHYVVATEGPSGMTFYVDGQLIGTNANTNPQNYTGYWRVGGDNLNGGWNLDPWGSNSQGTTQPADYNVTGSIGDVAVYPAALSAAQVAAHFAANQGSH
jgi:hypothetical protein